MDHQKGDRTTVSRKAAFRLNLCRSVTLLLGLGLAACTELETLPAERPAVFDTLPDPAFASKLSRAELALSNGQTAAARAAYLSAVQISSGDPRAILGLAESHLAMGQHERARPLLDTIDEDTPGIHAARLNQARGIIALRMEQPDLARKWFQRSVDADASLWRAWIGLGRVRLMLQQKEDARIAFLMAEKTAPSSASAMNDIGMGYLRLEDSNAAIRHFKRALTLEPGHVLAQSNLRIVKAMQGDFRGAIQGADAQRRHHVLNNVGYVALMQGEYALADRYLRQAIQLSPTHHRIATANLNLIPE